MIQEKNDSVKDYNSNGKLESEQIKLESVDNELVDPIKSTEDTFSCHFADKRNNPTTSAKTYRFIINTFINGNIF